MGTTPAAGRRADDAASVGCAVGLGGVLLGTGTVVAVGGLWLSTWSLVGSQPADLVWALPGLAVAMVGLVVMLAARAPRHAPAIVATAAVVALTGGIVAALTPVTVTAAVNTGVKDPDGMFGEYLWRTYSVRCGSAVGVRDGLRDKVGAESSTERSVCRTAVRRRRGWAVTALVGGAIGIVVAVLLARRRRRAVPV